MPPGVVLNGGPAVTQTTAGPVSGYRALTSVSATKTGTPIEQIPQSVTVLPRAVIEDQQPQSQNEIFRNVSGVSGMPSNEFLGYAYKVRGFPADRYVDGLPNYYDGGDIVSLTNVERIEVLKGPAGILYQAGIGPVGGIINVVSKLPTATPSYQAGITAGGYSLWNPWFDINQPLNKNGTALFRMTGDFERSRDYVDVIEHGRYSFNPTLRFDNHDGTTFTLQGGFSQRRFQAYNGLPGAGTVDTSVFTVRPNLFPADPNLPKSTITYNGVTARFEHEMSDTWSMNAATRVSQLRMTDYNQYFGDGLGDATKSPRPVFGSTFAVLNGYFPLDVQELSSNVNVVAKSTIGPAENVFLFGADYDTVHDKISFDTAFAGLVDLSNPTFPTYSIPSASAFNSNNRYENSGLTAQLQSTLWERLHLLAGVRFGHVRIHSVDYTNATDFTTDEWKPLPRLGTVLDLVPGISVFADYSEGMRGVPFFKSSSAPRPELAQQLEGGLKLVLPSGFTSTVSYFTIARENVVTALPGSPGVATQVGAERSKGIDIDLTWQPLPGLSILASYAHINAYVVNDDVYLPGKIVDRVPRDSGRLWANYKFQNGLLRDISIGGGFYAASSQAVSLDNTYFTPGYVTFDAKIGYETKQWALALVGKNLTNRHYYEPFPSGVGLISPGQPLTVYAVATLKY
ncbi:MAG TPA: TonB-dependent siderophore receptor [Pseudolabrys sp.]|nr:TonB-dependent siderophore receptor [Pseudolabrys sp.]